MKTLYNLVKARNAKNLTQAAMAELLGIAVPTYTQYETGRNKPNYEMLILISRVLDVSIDYLVDNKRVSSEEQLNEIESDLLVLIDKIRKLKK